jgi:hypothetical protein
LILFDAHKLDISDEFKKVLDAMKQYEEKVNLNVDILISDIDIQFCRCGLWCCGCRRCGCGL